MANYNALKDSIRSVIKENGSNEITGNLLQQSLLAIVNSLGAGYQFAGVATTSTSPGTPDYNVFYIAGPGTYANFGGTVVNPGRLGLFYYNGSWAYEVADLSQEGYTFAGIARFLTDPGTPKSKVFYIAGEGGTYDYFGITLAFGEMAALCWDGTGWTKTRITGLTKDVVYPAASFASRAYIEYSRCAEENTWIYRSSGQFDAGTVRILGPGTIKSTGATVYRYVFYSSLTEMSANTMISWIGPNNLPASGEVTIPEGAKVVVINFRKDANPNGYGDLVVRQTYAGATIESVDALAERVAELEGNTVGFKYMGVAYPATDPGTPEQSVFYIVGRPGPYTNFGGLSVGFGEIATLCWDGTAWSKKSLSTIVKDTAYPALSFAGLAYIDYGHLVDSADYSYKSSGTYDAGWARILGTGNIKISGAVAYRVTFFSSLTEFGTSTMLKSYSVSNIPSTGIIPIPEGAKVVVVNFRKADNPNGYEDFQLTQEGAGATKAEVKDAVSNIYLQRVVGKNLINPDDLMYGYSWDSSGGWKENANGILSNKMYLSPGRYTIQGVRPYNADTARILLFKDNDELIRADSISLNADTKVGTYYVKCDSSFFYVAYYRIMLQYNTTRPFNPAVAQFEKGTTATAWEACVTEPYLNPALEHEPKFIFLSGASIAMAGNGWFENACESLGYGHRNVAVSGESVMNAANKLWRGTLFAEGEFEKTDVLVLSHTHNHNVASTTSTGILTGTVAEYEAKGYTSSGTALDHAPDPTNPDEYLIPLTGGNTTERYAAGFDYLLKKYAAMCYNERLNPTSKWYGTKTGKPCVVVICSYWHDAHTVYNAAAKELCARHGAIFCDFASMVGFSYQQTDPSDPDSIRQSALYCNNSAFGGSNDLTDVTIGSVTYTDMGWHPTRDVNSYLSKKRGNYLAEILKIATGEGFKNAI